MFLNFAESKMSGGERKVKRNPRAQGWEEAGGEFYQESYPGGEAELEAMHQNPSNIATLLPSKQNRTGESFNLVCYFTCHHDL